MARVPARLGCRAQRAVQAGQRLPRTPGSVPARQGWRIHRAAGWPSGQAPLLPVQAPADSAMMPQRHLQPLHNASAFPNIECCSALGFVHQMPQECCKPSRTVQGDSSSPFRTCRAGRVPEGAQCLGHGVGQGLCEVGCSSHRVEDRPVSIGGRRWRIDGCCCLCRDQVRWGGEVYCTRTDEDHQALQSGPASASEAQKGVQRSSCCKESGRKASPATTWTASTGTPAA